MAVRIDFKSTNETKKVTEKTLQNKNTSFDSHLLY